MTIVTRYSLLLFLYTNWDGGDDDDDDDERSLGKGDLRVLRGFNNA